MNQIGPSVPPDWAAHLQPGERLLWQARPNILLPSLIAVGVAAVALWPALATLRHLLTLSMGWDCGTLRCLPGDQNLFMVLIALILAALAGIVLLLLPTGLLRLTYALTDQRMLILRRLFGQSQLTSLPVQGLRLAAGRGFSLQVIAADAYLQPHKAMIFSLSPADLRRLREALPKEALS